jgi:hypothetical protein
MGCSWDFSRIFHGVYEKKKNLETIGFSSNIPSFHRMLMVFFGLKKGV